MAYPDLPRKTFTRASRTKASERLGKLRCPLEDVVSMESPRQKSSFRCAVREHSRVSIKDELCLVNSLRSYPFDKFSLVSSNWPQQLSRL